MKCNINIELPQCLNSYQINVLYKIRDYWKRYAVWTRAYLNSRYYLDIGASNDTYNHLYNLPNELTNLLEYFFGINATEKYKNLLHQQIIILKNLIDAHISNNTELINLNINLLYQNAKERAEYLSNLNPYWETEKWQPTLDNYVKDTISQVNDISTMNYLNSINTYDQILSNANNMADFYTLGLFKLINIVPPQTPIETCITLNQVNTNYQIRSFWFDIATWTRAVLVSKLSDSRYYNFAQERLKQVPENFGNLLKTYFSDNEVDEFLQVVNNQIELIIELIDAEYTGNIKEINRLSTLLYESVNKRAELLGTMMNPYLDKIELKKFLYMYTQKTIEEISSFFSNDYSTSINMHNDILDLASHAGDFLSQGILEYSTLKG